jgi:hypothetical protein
MCSADDSTSRRKLLLVFSRLWAFSKLNEPSKRGKPNFPKNNYFPNLEKRSNWENERGGNPPHYQAVGEIRDEILSWGGRLALSTVSKVLARMEEDLIVSRDMGGIRLVQPKKLLDALVRQYEPPRISQRISGKTSLDITELAARINESPQRRDLRVVPTGTSSIAAYAVMVLARRLFIHPGLRRRQRQRLLLVQQLHQLAHLTVCFQPNLL